MTKNIKNESTNVNGWRFSPETLSILKNFASIRNSILVDKGNVLTTLSPGNNILGEATVSENFPVSFAIWDLNQFIGVISLFSDSVLEWNEKSVTIVGKGSSGNTNRIIYLYADPEVIRLTNKKIKNSPNPILEFDITQKQFEEIHIASKMMQLPHVCVEPLGDSPGAGICINALDKNNDSTNIFSLEISPSSVTSLDVTGEFSFVFDRDNLKMLPGDYRVSITDKMIAKFTHSKYNLFYWIALETISKNPNEV
jgi:hypothetical protein